MRLYILVFRITFAILRPLLEDKLSGPLPNAIIIIIIIIIGSF